jgi:hypothetical protein
MNQSQTARSREDLLLAALYASPLKALSPVQVQKAIFLISQEAKSHLPPKFYKFEKYNYGPFCQQLYNDLGVFAAHGLLAVEQPADNRVRIYRLTATGAAQGKAVSADLSAPLRDYIERVAKWVTSLPFPDLIREIYQRYPEYKENSIFSG